MENILRNFGQYIKVYLAKTSIDDPYEKNKTISYQNPLPIKAIVTDLSPAKIQWNLTGIITDKAKEIIIEKKYELLLLQSYKITIQGENDEYIGWKQNGKFQYRKEGNYIRFYMYIKKEN